MKNTFAVKTSLFTLILALIAIGTFAFTAVMKKQNLADQKVDPANQTWHYTGGTDPGEFAMAENWDLGTSPEACDNGEVLPCQISNVQADDRTQLQQILNDYEGDAIFNIASSKSTP